VGERVRGREPGWGRSGTPRGPGRDRRVPEVEAGTGLGGQVGRVHLRVAAGRRRLALPHRLRLGGPRAGGPRPGDDDEGDARGHVGRGARTESSHRGDPARPGRAAGTGPGRALQGSVARRGGMPGARGVRRHAPRLGERVPHHPRTLPRGRHEGRRGRRAETMGRRSVTAPPADRAGPPPPRARRARPPAQRNRSRSRSPNGRSAA